MNMKLSVRRADESSEAQSKAPAGSCPSCRCPIPPSAPISRPNCSIRSIADILRRSSKGRDDEDDDKNEIESDAEYKDVCKELEGLYARKGWDNKTWKRKLHLILAGAACVPSFAPLIDVLSDSDDDDAAASDDGELVSKLIRESFGDRSMSRTLVVDSDDSHMRLALSFGSFPRKVRFDRPFTASLAILRMEEDECGLVPPMVTEDDRGLVARDIVECEMVCDLRYRATSEGQRLLEGPSSAIAEAGAASKTDDGREVRDGGATPVTIEATLKNGVVHFTGLCVPKPSTFGASENCEAIIRFAARSLNLHLIMTFPVKDETRQLDDGSESGEENQMDDSFGGVRIRMGVVVGNSEDEEDETDALLRHDDYDDNDSFIASEGEISVENGGEESEDEYEEASESHVVDAVDSPTVVLSSSRRPGATRSRTIVVSSSSDDEEDNDGGSEITSNIEMGDRARAALRANAAVARIESRRRRGDQEGTERPLKRPRG